MAGKIVSRKKGRGGKIFSRKKAQMAQKLRVGKIGSEHGE
jgi:hypothetical protein